MHIVTGTGSALENRLLADVRRAMEGSERNVIVLVPSQMTLQAELLLLSGEVGSFRLQVLSLERLYKRVFAEAGSPSGVLIDRQGRVMLMRACVNAVKSGFVRYQGACEASGFADRAVSQIEALKQAHISPDVLAARLESIESRTLHGKLQDILLLYTEYERRIKGRFLDGEGETQAACARMGASPFVRNSDVFAYGFDTVTPTLADTLLAVSAAAEGETELCIMADADSGAKEIYAPVLSSLRRFSVEAERRGIAVSTEILPREPAKDELRHLEQMLFSYPVAPWDAAPRQIQIAGLKNAKTEAEFAAGLARQLVRAKSWRWRDILIACRNLDTEYADALQSAFRLYDVPLFVTSGRRASRHPFARYFLSVLRMAFTGIATRDVEIALASGYLPVEKEDADRLINYAVRFDIRPKRWTVPFQYGSEAEEAEPIRLRVAEPLIALAKAVREAPDTASRVKALYAHLEESGAAARLFEEKDEAIARGDRGYASECAQVWNRILKAMEQLHELMGEEKLPLATFPEVFEQALDTQEIKLLPLSHDAVNAGDLSHMKGENVRAVFLLGVSDTTVGAPDALLDDRETETLSNLSGKWLSMDASDRSMLRLLSVKALLSLPQEYLFVSYPMSGDSGNALRRGSLIRHIQNLFPQLEVKDGVRLPDSMRKVLLSAPAAALGKFPIMLREEIASPDAGNAARGALASLSGDDTIKRLLSASRAANASQMRLPRDVARMAYGALDRISPTQLEQYAACPYQHFVRRGLKPVKLEPYSLSRSDEGTVLHEAVERFVRDNCDLLMDMQKDEAAERMLAIADALLFEKRAEGRLSGYVGDLQEGILKKKLFRASSTLVSHLKGSAFLPSDLEREIAPNLLTVGGASVIGRIDRIDTWESENGRYVRVIDYKSGASDCNLGDIYNGLKLQLAIYLLCAMLLHRAQPAGAIYFGVKDAVVADDSRKIADIEQERAKKLAMSGFMVADTELYSAMAENPQEALGIKLTKDGIFYATANALDGELLQKLLRRALRFAEEYLADIRDGIITACPVKKGDDLKICSHCEAKGMCPFDEMLPGAEQVIRTMPRSMNRESVETALDTEPSP